MRVVHICQHDDPETGGSIRVAEALVRAQRAAGIEAWILFLYGPPRDLTASFLPHAVGLELESSKQALKGCRMLIRALKKIAPDIIHSHDGILWPRLAYLRLHIPVVTHAHLPAGNPSLPKKLLGWPLIKSTSDHVIGISRDTADSWIAAGYPARQLTEIPNGVDFSRFEPVSASDKVALRERLGIPKDSQVLLWLGRLHREMKGTDRAERVASHLPDGYVLVVVGNGPEFEGMTARGSKAIEGGKLIMAGSTASPVDFYQAADAFLFTSYYEPFGLVILEAVACNLPILAFRVTRGGGAADLLKEFHALELRDDFNGEQLSALLTELETLKENSAGVREMVMKKYAWSAVSEQTVKVYEHVRAGGVL